MAQNLQTGKEAHLEELRSDGKTIEHIGSTAVPGLSAKPIIDIMETVNDAADADHLKDTPAKVGYEDIKIEGNSEWFYCLGRATPRIGYHLHLVKSNSEHWKRHILFRDYLRAHPEIAHEYGELKKRLAEEYRTTRKIHCSQD